MNPLTAWRVLWDTLTQVQWTLDRTNTALDDLDDTLRELDRRITVLEQSHTELARRLDALLEGRC